jgi:ABC-2 type transport system ATP-binding protein
MIQVRNLTRSYGDFRAVSKVSFEIGHGEVVGLLGHNGAGKTTIMKMLTGFLEPSAGEICIDGMDVLQRRQEVQALIGYLPENCPLYPEMTVIDYLDYQAGLHGVEERHRPRAIRRAIGMTRLEPKATQPIGTLSRGYRQRVGVAQAILHRPRILILDEPTNGLDPTQIHHMRELIQELAQEATVILSTHILQEVQAVCERVLILRAGDLVLDARLDELQHSGRLLVALDRAPGDALATLQQVNGVKGASHLQEDGGQHHYALELNGGSPREIAAAVARSVAEQGFALFALQPEARDLETVFRQIENGHSVEMASLNRNEVAHG